LFSDSLPAGLAWPEGGIEKELQVRPVKDLDADNPPVYEIEDQVPTLHRKNQVPMRSTPGTQWFGCCIEGGAIWISTVAAINDLQCRDLMSEIITLVVS